MGAKHILRGKPLAGDDTAYLLRMLETTTLCGDACAWHGTVLKMDGELPNYLQVLLSFLTTSSSLRSRV